VNNTTAIYRRNGLCLNIQDNVYPVNIPRWLPFPVPEIGAEGWSTLLEKIDSILNSIFVLLGLPGTLGTGVMSIR